MIHWQATRTLVRISKRKNKKKKRFGDFKWEWKRVHNKTRSAQRSDELKIVHVFKFYWIPVNMKRNFIDNFVILYFPFPLIRFSSPVRYYFLFHLLALILTYERWLFVRFSLFDRWNCLVFFISFRFFFFIDWIFLFHANKNLFFHRFFLFCSNFILLFVIVSDITMNVTSRLTQRGFCWSIYVVILFFFYPSFFFFVFWSLIIWMSMMWTLRDDFNDVNLLGDHLNAHTWKRVKNKKKIKCENHWVTRKTQVN